MLSNPPPTNLQNRQRQHRRQNSTPTAFEPMKVTALPKTVQRPGHRRGMSLDQRPRHAPAQDPAQFTNQGYPTTPQHILRETQQQRLARPGHFATFGNDENYMGSPLVNPQRQSFDAGYSNPYAAPVQQHTYSFSGPINSAIPVDPRTFNGPNDYDLYAAETVMTPTFMSYFQDPDAPNGHSRPSSACFSSRRSSFDRRASIGLDRVPQFGQQALQSPHRPVTPPEQNTATYLPSPLDSPFSHVKPEPTNRRFQDDYDTSMEETLKPKSNVRARGIFDDMRAMSEMKANPSPPRTGPIPAASTFDSAPMPSGNFMSMTNVNLDFLKNEASFNGSQYSPTSTQVSPDHEYRSSPDVPHMALFTDPFANRLHLEAPGQSAYPPLPMYNNEPPATGSPTRSSHRRSESIHSFTSSVNQDESINDTGITIDDIATFISGPDPVTNKWLCLFPECKKVFGRKENIKSHVQTHLGDRQYQCPHCHKCFVRQHDLKRHAKIHSGVKPYPCQCGNSFARHDALTRHRQRGMCIGAFEGVVKKMVKRGRPRKVRPDDEERVSKTTRTKSKNQTHSSASSMSGYSESGSAQSPRDDLDVLDDKPFGDYTYGYASSPAPPDHMSPQKFQSHSPSAFSTHSNYSTRSPLPPPSPNKSSPPDLCSSSSPLPAPSFFVNPGLGLSNISEQDDEMFMDAFAASAGPEGCELERNPDVLMAKFEDVFVGSVGEEGLERYGEEIYFGSP